MTGRPASASALVRLSISATDEEWARAGERAERRRQSISRCLVEAALADDGAPAADGGQERVLLEAVLDLCRRWRRPGIDGMRPPRPSAALWSPCSPADVCSWCPAPDGGIPKGQIRQGRASNAGRRLNPECPPHPAGGECDAG